MSELIVLGASHKTAPLALRERIALTDGAAEALLAELVERRDGGAPAPAHRPGEAEAVRAPVETEAR